jgi:drug/metabolite transporter (DMT)-like permease
MASAILFSGKGVLMKLAFAEGASVWLFMALRMAYALPLFLWLWFRASNQAKMEGRPPFQKSDWLLVIVLGMLGYYLAGLLDISGLQYVSAGLERLILYTHPSLVVLFSWLIYRQALTWRLGTALVLGYAGLLLAFSEETKFTQGHLAWLGGGLIFGSALCYAAFLILSGRHVHRLGPDRMFVAGSLICTVAALIQGFILVEPAAWLASIQVHLLAMLVAVLGTVLPTVLLGIAMKQLGPERTAVYGMVGPVFTLVLGYFVLQEPFTWRNAGGLVLTLLGGALLSREQKKWV